MARVSHEAAVAGPGPESKIPRLLHGHCSLMLGRNLRARGAREVVFGTIPRRGGGSDRGDGDGSLRISRRSARNARRDRRRSAEEGRDLEEALLPLERRLAFDRPQFGRPRLAAARRRAASRAMFSVPSRTRDLEAGPRRATAPSIPGGTNKGRIRWLRMGISRWSGAGTTIGSVKTRARRDAGDSAIPEDPSRREMMTASMQTIPSNEASRWAAGRRRPAIESRPVAEARARPGPRPRDRPCCGGRPLHAHPVRAAIRSAGPPEPQRRRETLPPERGRASR